MASEVAESYRSSLEDLKMNSKPQISMLTMLAEDHEQCAAEIVKVIEDRIKKVPVLRKLPILYLIDSIMKNLPKTMYPQLFEQCIVQIFCGVFDEVDEKTRQSMYKLRQTWADILSNKRLYAMDVRVNLTDPAWPITAKAPEQGVIHVNPKFLKTSKDPLPYASPQPRFSPQKESSISDDDELLAKEKELQKVKLEIELAETKAKLEQSKKQLEQQQKMQAMKNKRAVDREPPSIIALPPAPKPAPAPKSRDPRLNRDPRVNRDPRLKKAAEQIQQPEKEVPPVRPPISPAMSHDTHKVGTTVPPVAQSPEKKQPSPKRLDLVELLTSFQNIASKVAVESKKQHLLDNSQKGGPPQLKSQDNLAPQKMETKTKTIEPTAKAYSKALSKTPPPSSGKAKSKPEVKDLKKATVAEKVKESQEQAKVQKPKVKRTDRKDNKTEASEKGKPAEQGVPIQRKGKDLAEPKGSEFVSGRKDNREKTAEEGSYRIPHRKFNNRLPLESRREVHKDERGNRHGRNRTWVKGRDGQPVIHSSDGKTDQFGRMLRKDAENKKSNSKDRSPETRDSHHGSRSPRTGNHNNQKDKIAPPDLVKSESSYTASKKEPSSMEIEKPNEVSIESGVKIVTEPSRNSSENPLGDIQDVDMRVNLKYEAIESDSESIKEENEDQHQESSLKRPFSESDDGQPVEKQAKIEPEIVKQEIKAEVDLSKLFGEEDVDYRNLGGHAPPIPPPIPPPTTKGTSHRRWSQFKEKHPDDFALEMERKRLRDAQFQEVHDIDMRQQLTSPRQKALPLPPQVDVAANVTENNPDSRARILQQAELEIKEGRMSPGEHQKLLRQVGEVYDHPRHPKDMDSSKHLGLRDPRLRGSRDIRPYQEGNERDSRMRGDEDEEKNVSGLLPGKRGDLRLEDGQRLEGRKRPLLPNPPILKENEEHSPVYHDERDEDFRDYQMRDENYDDQPHRMHEFEKRRKTSFDYEGSPRDYDYPEEYSPRDFDERPRRRYEHDRRPGRRGRMLRHEEKERHFGREGREPYSKDRYDRPRGLDDRHEMRESRRGGYGPRRRTPPDMRRDEMRPYDERDDQDSDMRGPRPYDDDGSLRHSGNPGRFRGRPMMSHDETHRPRNRTHEQHSDGPHEDQVQRDSPLRLEEMGEGPHESQNRPPIPSDVNARQFGPPGGNVRPHGPPDMQRPPSPPEGALKPPGPTSLPMRPQGPPMVPFRSQGPMQRQEPPMAPICPQGPIQPQEPQMAPIRPRGPTQPEEPQMAPIRPQGPMQPQGPPVVLIRPQGPIQPQGPPVVPIRRPMQPQDALRPQGPVGPAHHEMKSITPASHPGSESASLPQPPGPGESAVNSGGPENIPGPSNPSGNPEVEPVTQGVPNMRPQNETQIGPANPQGPPIPHPAPSEKLRPPPILDEGQVRPIGPDNQAPGLANNQGPLPQTAVKPVISDPLTDPRWAAMVGLLDDGTEEVVLDDKPFELRMGTARKLRMYGQVIEVAVDLKERGIRIDGQLVYKLGEPIKEVTVGGRTMRLYYHGMPKPIWLNGQQYEMRVDAPPRNVMVDGVQRGFQIDGRDLMILVDRLEKGIYGGPPRKINIAGRDHEISFQFPSREINIDNKPCVLKLDSKIPYVMIDGKPHGIRFNGDPQTVIINGQPFTIPLDRAERIRIGTRATYIAFGGPAHEIIIDGKWFEVNFDNQPKDIHLGNRHFNIQLPGPLPRVKILNQFPPNFDESRMLMSNRMVAKSEPPSPMPHPGPVSTPMMGPMRTPGPQGMIQGGMGMIPQGPHILGQNNLALQQAQQLLNKDLPDGKPLVSAAQALLASSQANLLGPQLANSGMARLPMNPLDVGQLLASQAGLRAPNQAFMHRNNPLGLMRAPMGTNPLLQRMALRTNLMQANAGMLSQPQPVNLLAQGLLNQFASSMIRPNMPPGISDLAAGIRAINQINSHNQQQMHQNPISKPQPLQLPQPAVPDEHSAAMSTGLQGTPYSAHMKLQQPNISAPVPVSIKAPQAPSTSIPQQTQASVPGTTPSTQPIKTENTATSSVEPSGTSDAPAASSKPVDINDLLQNLLKVGLISTPTVKTEPDQTPIKDQSAEKSSQQITEAIVPKPVKKGPVVPGFTNFEVPSLKMYHKFVIDALHEGMQCHTCSARFTLDDQDKYRAHLDWHFRQNRLEQEMVKVAKNRKWFYSLTDWIQFEELEETSEKSRSQVFEQLRTGQEEMFAGVDPLRMRALEGKAVEKNPVASGVEGEDVCVTCGDPFDQMWNEETEEWILKNTIKVNGKTYHPVCYEDEQETPTPSVDLKDNPLDLMVSDASTLPVSAVPSTTDDSTYSVKATGNNVEKTDNDIPQETVDPVPIKSEITSQDSEYGVSSFDMPEQKMEVEDVKPILSESSTATNLRIEENMPKEIKTDPDVLLVAKDTTPVQPASKSPCHGNTVTTIKKDPDAISHPEDDSTSADVTTNAVSQSRSQEDIMAMSRIPNCLSTISTSVKREVIQVSSEDPDHPWEVDSNPTPELSRTPSPEPSNTMTPETGLAPEIDSAQECSEVDSVTTSLSHGAVSTPHEAPTSDETRVNNS